MNKIEKIEAGRYIYRGVLIFKDKHYGFAYSYSVRTDNYSAGRNSFPVTLKMVVEKIEHDLNNNGGVVENRRIIFDSRTTTKAGN